jgi:RNA polymerase sigma-70 factor (ECF subfamily)
VLLEKLSPEERAVFLLKDIFEYGHSEVAEMLGLTVENSRQLLHRAKARLAEPRPQPALIIRVDERLESIFVFSIDGDTVSAIRVVRNPDKLAHIDRRLATH